MSDLFYKIALQSNNSYTYQESRQKPFFFNNASKTLLRIKTILETCPLDDCKKAQLQEAAHKIYQGYKRKIHLIQSNRFKNFIYKLFLRIFPIQRAQAVENLFLEILRQPPTAEHTLDQKLPKDVLNLIFAQLKVSDLYAVMKTCRVFNKCGLRVNSEQLTGFYDRVFGKSASLPIHLKFLNTASEADFVKIFKTALEAKFSKKEWLILIRDLQTPPDLALKALSEILKSHLACPHGSPHLVSFLISAKSEVCIPAFLEKPFLSSSINFSVFGTLLLANLKMAKAQTLAHLENLPSLQKKFFLFYALHFGQQEIYEAMKQILKKDKALFHEKNMIPFYATLFWGEDHRDYANVNLECMANKCFSTQCLLANKTELLDGIAIEEKNYWIGPTLFQDRFHQRLSNATLDYLMQHFPFCWLFLKKDLADCFDTDRLEQIIQKQSLYLPTNMGSSLTLLSQAFNYLYTFPDHHKINLSALSFSEKVSLAASIEDPFKKTREGMQLNIETLISNIDKLKADMAKTLLY